MTFGTWETEPAWAGLAQEFKQEGAVPGNDGKAFTGLPSARATAGAQVGDWGQVSGRHWDFVGSEAFCVLLHLVW